MPSIRSTQALDNGVKSALQDLRQGIECLKSDIILYKILITAMQDGTNPDGPSLFAIFITKLAGQEAMKLFETGLKAARLMLEANPAGNHHEATKHPSGSKKTEKAPYLVLTVLKPNLRPESIASLNEATREINVCQQNTERAFKLVWNLYVTTQRHTGRRSSVYNVGNIQDNVEQALDSVLHGFHLHPFALSPEGDSRVNLLTFAALNHNHQTATRYEELARRLGRAWVDDRIQNYNAQIRDLAVLQTSLFELFWSGTIEQIKKPDVNSSSDPEQPEFEKALLGLEKALREMILRSKERRIAIAFCGTARAGKSLFLNALMGRAILPSELPSTAWPCRLRHVEGQKVPELHFHADPFLSALNKLQYHQYGQKMRTYEPPSEDIFEALLSDGLSDAPSEPSEEEVKLKKIHSKWIDLHAATRSNLLKFENPHFHLPRQASGEQDVKTLLGQLNDIVRLCLLFDLKFDMSEVDWPLLTVEFNSLRGHRRYGIYEFIDLPDFRDSFTEFSFESLVRLVASDTNVIVPIVSFKELPRSDWRRLPDLITGGFDGRANMVVCTHLGQISQDNMEEQRRTVAKTFWPRDVMNTNSVILCSSLMGLGARDLLDKSSINKPPFGEIWKEDAVGYHCAAKILGVGDPEAAYKRFSFQMWKSKLEREFHASGLPGAIQELTREMVDRPRIQALLSEADTITKYLKELRSVQGRKLLEARRTRNDYNAARRSYDHAREQILVVLDTWKSQEYMQIQDNRQLLERASTLISKKAGEFINKAIETTLKDCTLGNIRSVDGDLSRSTSTGGKQGSKVLTVKTVENAEEFLRLSQRELHSSLNGLKSEYVVTIRKLAEKAKEKRFNTLREGIKHLDSRLQPELREEIENDLETQSISIRKVAVQQIRSMIRAKDIRQTSQTASRVIEERLARLPIWPWIVHPRTYHLEMDVVYHLYREESINPWIRSLKEEGEKCLIGTIELSSHVARELVTSALTREDKRYNRELDAKNKLTDQGAMQHIITIYGNLVAAEAALTALVVHIKERARSVK